jgi:hypothetical protein
VALTTPHLEAVTMTAALTLPAGIGPATFTLPDHLSYEDWARLGHALVRVHRGVQWWIGDWLLYGEHRYGEKYAQATVETGLSPDSLKRFQWVASRLPPERRHPALSFSHHEAVAAMPADAADAWLELAEQRQLSSRDFRAEVRAAGPTPQPPADDAAAGRLRADTPAREDTMSGDLPTPERFGRLIELALTRLAGDGTPTHRTDGDLVGILDSTLHDLELTLADRGNPPPAGVLVTLGDHAATLAAAAYLILQRDRLRFPGTGDITEADLAETGDDE